MLNSDNSNSTNDLNTQNQTQNIDFNKPLCDQIPASLVSGAIGKDILKTQPISSSTTNICQYFVDSTHFVTLRLNNLSYENQKKGQEGLGRQITTNDQIQAEHFVAIQKDGKINDIVIKIDDNLFLAVDRNSLEAATEEQLINLASQVATYINNGVTTNQNTDNDADKVTTQTDEGFIKNFFGLIEAKKASDAVMIMTKKNTSNDSVKQAWAVQFNNINSVKVASIEPSMQNSWTDTTRQYKVSLDVVMNPNSANAPIPYYGYENGLNTRFVSLVKEDGAWRIDGIATGP